MQDFCLVNALDHPMQLFIEPEEQSDVFFELDEHVVNRNKELVEGLQGGTHHRFFCCSIPSSDLLTGDSDSCWAKAEVASCSCVTG